ncbi:MAG TPA: glycosyltransferase family 4 protein, partial [Cyclobacteriaceae bacterium]|nr:glycosyltransferase family 4 protein [Cyclobacteriaceae bacterium]
MHAGEKHILWLTENYPPLRGGMSQSCDRIVNGLRKHGFRIHIIHFTNRNEPFITDSIHNGSYSVIPIYENEAHTANLCWNYIGRMPYTFSKVVSFGGYIPILTGPVYAKWMQIPLVTLLRGNDFDTSVFNSRRRSLLDDALLGSESVGCVSMDEVQKIKRLYPGLHPAYTPNGIEIKEWEVLPSDKKFAETWRLEKLDGRLSLGIFGQVKEKKGLEVLLQGIKKSEVSHRYFLIVTGAENEQLRDILVPAGIRFELLPFLDRSELVKYYAACDAVVIPSHYEGMPNVMLEAGALGVPVIASATGGMKDVMAGFDT